MMKKVVRICDLRKGDIFEMSALTWMVVDRNYGRISFKQYRYGRSWKSRWGTDIDSRGARSMQFVYLIKKGI
jgi:NMD protein affecting ribosome stability and mRNA decay